MPFVKIYGFKLSRASTGSSVVVYVLINKNGLPITNWYS
jgi:hypothetical protein